MDQERQRASQWTQQLSHTSKKYFTENCDTEAHLIYIYQKEAP